MAMSSTQAQNYLINPFIAPEPVDETGLNATFRSTFAPSTALDAGSNGTNGDNKSQLVHERRSDASPKRQPRSGTRSRGQSLSERFPGDTSHRPLDVLREENTAAHKSHHLRKSSLPGVDSIDALDKAPVGQYHHEGPYDAAMACRNTNPQTSPVAAVADSNREALKATPTEKVKDAVENHRPLDFTASIAPGEQDRYGRIYDYQETNLMTELGRLPDDNDFESTSHRDRNNGVASHDSGVAAGIELYERSRPSQDKKSIEIHETEVDEAESSSRRHSLEALKRRIGSLRRKKD